jgi:hypothetical protein
MLAIPSVSFIRVDGSRVNNQRVQGRMDKVAHNAVGARVIIRGLGGSEGIHTAVEI